jgi:tetratricopeptide (TPR) repeat protein
LSTRRAKISHVDDPVAVGRRLRQARERAGLSQRQLAFPGCSPAYLSRIEAGDRTPSLQLLRELARRLNVSEDYLAYGKAGSVAASDPLFEANVALRMDERELAERLFREQLEADDVDTRAAALEGLGQLAFREGDAHEAIRLLEEASSLFGEQAASRRALTDTLGRAYASVGELEASIALYEQALRAAEERDDLLDSVRFRVLLSCALSDSGQFGRAEELLASALSHADELADPQARVRIYWAQCRLHILEGRPDLAERYGRRVIELMELTEDSFHLARAYRLMAHIELDREKPTEALELLEQADAILGRAGHDQERAEIALNQARALAQLGELERAASLAMEVAGTLSEWPAEAGRSFTLLAQAFAGAGERAKAIELTELACEFLEKTPNRFLVEAYGQLAELLEAEGKKDAAFEIMKKALQIQASTHARAPSR